VVGLWIVLGIVWVMMNPNRDHAKATVDAKKDGPTIAVGSVRN
jgi:hypothetical protein